MDLNRENLGVVQVKVGKHQVGIIGLKEIFEELESKMVSIADEVISEELVRRLEEFNYIPDTSHKKYGKAFLRMYKKHLGQPHQENKLEEKTTGLVIKVLGEGCAQCNKLEQDVMKILVELKLPADFEHLTEVAQFSKFNSTAVPTLIINGEVKSAGWVPSQTKIKEWLMDIQTNLIA